MQGNARLVALAMLAVGFTWAIDGARLWMAPALAAPRFALVASDAVSRGIPVLHEIARHQLPPPVGKPSSHSSSIVLATNAAGHRSLMAFWYAGTKEGAADVEIVASRFDIDANQWSRPVVVLNRHDLARDLDFGVRRLGNPVAWVDVRGRMHLFTVATGFGGWATSRVVHLVSEDGGSSFAPLHVLPLSPLFNMSNLVRAPAVALADGGALLPLYFDLGNKYPVAVRVSPLGEPVEVVRMSHDDEALQPAIAVIDELNAVALLRDPGAAGTLKLVSTRDGGRSWSDEGATNLENPNSSVAAARLPGGGLVAALNPSREGRGQLVIAVSGTGRNWTIVESVDSGAEHEEFSYPSLLVDGNRLHLTYTHKREGIKHRIYRIGSLRP